MCFGRKEAKNKKEKFLSQANFTTVSPTKILEGKRGYKSTPFYVSHNNLEQQNFYRFCRRHRRVDSCLRILGFYMMSRDNIYIDIL